MKTKFIKKFNILCIFAAILLTFCVFSPAKFLTGESHATATPSKKPIMSIVIDDFGSFDQSGVETMLSCPKPLTCAVIPFVDNTEKNAADAKKCGHEVILHMPMQAHVSLPESWYGPVYITNYDQKDTICKKLDECLKNIGDVSGINCHIGSGVSRNVKQMETIYDYAKRHNLFYLDSRTIISNASEQACKNVGAIYLGRNVFLEADKNKSYSGVRARLLEGAKTAKENGTAIVIGHVGAEGGENTARAVLDSLKEIEDMGVEIVPLSTLFGELQASSKTSNM